MRDGDSKRKVANMHSTKSSGESAIMFGPLRPSDQPKKFTYAERRKAGNILKQQRDSNISTPSDDWLKKLKWARDVLPNFGQDVIQVERAQPKRQHSQELRGPSSKRPKVLPTMSFAEIAKERTLIAVLDQGTDDGRVPRRQWKWVEAALADRCFEMLALGNGPPPVCKDLGWYQGNVKIIACDGSRSVELYKAAVAALGEVYPGAKLIAVDWNDVPSRPRARVWIPASIKEPERILKMLQLCNPLLPTHDWRVVKVETNIGPTNQVVLLLNSESLAPLEAAKGEINFGFSSVTIKVYKSDVAAAGDKAVEQDFSSQIEVAHKETDPDGYTSDTSTLTRGLQALSHDDKDVDDDDDDDCLPDCFWDDLDAAEALGEGLSSAASESPVEKPLLNFSN